MIGTKVSQSKEAYCIYNKAQMKMISFRQALHVKQLLILITAARTYLGLKEAFPFAVIGHLIRKAENSQGHRDKASKGTTGEFTVHRLSGAFANDLKSETEAGTHNMELVVLVVTRDKQKQRRDGDGQPDER